ncbi:MAG TPA: universal stress protein [Alphaproteobacteria bacterium]
MKTILVHLAHDDDCRRRVETATGLAVAHGAHLVGIYTKSPHVTPPAIVGRGASAQFLREMEASAAAQAQDASAAFRTATERAGITAEFVQQPGEVMDVLAARSCSADLLVVSQTPPETVEDVLTGNRPDQAALVAACPTLIIPHGTGTPETGRRVLIAWKRTREAARAVRDALPILRRAQAVTALTVGPAASDDGSSAGLAAYLERYGIRAAMRPDYGDESDVGAVVLAHARDLDADMIVMGAYGHSRLREMILGGATAHILANTTVPVLMSH